MSNASDPYGLREVGQQSRERFGRAVFGVLVEQGVLRVHDVAPWYYANKQQAVARVGRLPHGARELDL